MINVFNLRFYSTLQTIIKWKFTDLHLFRLPEEIAKVNTLILLNIKLLNIDLIYFLYIIKRE